MAGTVLTNKGLSLITKLVAAKATLSFSRVAVGTGSVPSGTDPQNMIGLNAYKMDAAIESYGVSPEQTDVAFVVAQISSVEVQAGFAITEAGIFATDPDEGEILYAYLDLTDDPQYIYASTDAISKFAEITFNVLIGSVSSVTAIISPRVLVTRDEFDEELAKKVDSDGGSISDTESAVEEPTSAADKYPEIQASSGTTKTIFGLLARWVKSLKEDKVDASGGDIKDTKVSEFTASTTQWPVPAAGEAPKTLWGKVKKFCEDFKTWSAGVCLLAQLVSNTTTNNANLPASAAAVYQLAQAMLGYAPKAHASSATTYGAGNASNFGHVKLSDNYTSSAGAAANGVAASSKALADAYSVLNTNKSETGHTHDERYYTEAEVNQFLNLLLVELSSTRSPLTRGTTNDCLQITLEGFLYSVNPSTLNLPVSGLYGLLVVFRIQDWRCHIILPTNNSSIYVDRYENTKWTGWRVISTATV